MTNEEALDYFEHDVENLKEQQFYDENDTAIEADLMAIYAIEKQIPKKIRKFDERYWCPTCDMGPQPIYEPHCYNCGQALDWSEVDKNAD